MVLLELTQGRDFATVFPLLFPFASFNPFHRFHRFHAFLQRSGTKSTDDSRVSTDRVAHFGPR